MKGNAAEAGLNQLSEQKTKPPAESRTIRKVMTEGLSKVKEKAGSILRRNKDQTTAADVDKTFRELAEETSPSPSTDAKHTSLLETISQEQTQNPTKPESSIALATESNSESTSSKAESNERIEEPATQSSPEKVVEKPEEPESVRVTKKNVDAPTPQEKQQLDIEIRDLERELGIETPLDRIVEASYLVDYKFLKAGLISGNANVERMFGSRAWADWLRARAAIKQHGDKPLTPEVIRELHTVLTKRTNPQIRGQYRNLMLGGDYKNLGQPVRYTDAELAALQENPLLGFEEKPLETGDPPDPNRGLIVYPQVRNGEIYPPTVQLSEQGRQIFESRGRTNQALIEALMTDTCAWYNAQRKNPGRDPYALAAELQRKIISIHGFKDVNGRLSRLLMYWSMESQGVQPHIVEEPSSDILVSSEDWIKMVKEGRPTPDKRRKETLEQIGFEDQAELFGLSEERTFYDRVYQHLRQAPEQPEDGELIDHTYVESFLSEFDTELKQFRDYTSMTRHVELPDTGETVDVPEGGLVPDSYMQLLSMNPRNAKAHLEYLREHYFTNAEVFRGVYTNEDVTVQDALQLFSSYRGISSGYTAARREHISPSSITEITNSSVVETINSYNDMLISAYFQSQYPNKPSPISFAPPIKNMVSIHGNGQQGKDDSGLTIFDSPFVSTSFDETTSRMYARNQYKRGKSTLLITSKAPEIGNIVNFGVPGDEVRLSIPMLDSVYPYQPFEKEMLVTGGLDPRSVDKVDVWRRTKEGYPYPAFIVIRNPSSPDSLEVIDEKTKKKRSFRLNERTGEFEEVRAFGIMPRIRSALRRN